MSKRLAEFVDGFVAPLLGGGDVSIGPPVRPADFHELLAGVHTLRSLSGPGGSLLALRQARAQQVLADPGLPDPDGEELALWVGLYNVLALDHPERDRVWARAVTWQRVEQAARYWLQLSHPGSFEAALVRHLSVGAFVDLVRNDQILSSPDGEQRFVGQEVPRRRLRWAVPGALSVRDERVPWWSAPHTPEVERLLQDVLWASPITCLLRPRQAPPGWNPLTAAPYLQERAFARIVCHSWAATRTWIELGGAVLGALLFTLTGRPTQDPDPRPTDLRGTHHHGPDPRGDPRAGRGSPAIAALPATPIDAGPADVAALVGALIHVHFLRVLEFGARLGVAPTSRDRPVQMFLALPLLLPHLSQVLGQPLPSEPGAGFDNQVQRRWIEYVDHLGELIPRAVVENLLATLVPRVVKAASA